MVVCRFLHILIEKVVALGYNTEKDFLI